MQSVYLETTIISYLAARPSSDIVVAGHQKITHDWWQNTRTSYELFASELVVQEASSGDPQLAQKRLVFLTDAKLLQVTDECRDLAKHLIASGVIPVTSVADALHLAVAAVNALDFLLTWNCRHLANAAMRNAITSTLVAAGHSSPIICTPEELSPLKP